MLYVLNLGQWRRDYRAGYGIMRYSNGSYYTGQWRRDFRAPYGTMVYEQDVHYTGDWVKDKRVSLPINLPIEIF